MQMLISTVLSLHSYTKPEGIYESMGLQMLIQNAQWQKRKLCISNVGWEIRLYPPCLN